MMCDFCYYDEQDKEWYTEVTCDACNIAICMDQEYQEGIVSPLYEGDEFAQDAFDDGYAYCIKCGPLEIENWKRSVGDIEE